MTIGLHLLTYDFASKPNQTKGLDVVEPKKRNKFNKHVIHFEKLQFSLEDFWNSSH